MTPGELIRYGLLKPKDIRNFLTFAFVRNPFDRMVSEFHYRTGSFSDQDLARAQFGHFVRKSFTIVRRRDWRTFDNHLRPQFHFTSFRWKTCLDFCGRFESLEADIHNLLKLIPGELKCIHQLPIEKMSTREPYQNYYDSNTIDLVARMYKIDLKKFDYDF
jgi:hypothetical protein